MVPSPRPPATRLSLPLSARSTWSNLSAARSLRLQMASLGGGIGSRLLEVCSDSVTKTMLTTQRRENFIPGTVLVVGAAPTFRGLARSAFQRDGHDVVLAATGEDGCRVFDDRVPDLVVMDLGLPVVDGYEACERFRTRGNGARIPVLMLTGSDDADAISRAYEAGATDLQTKPVNWQVLRERVR